MKLFIYKTFTIMGVIFILYHITIGYHLKKTKIELYNLFDTEKIEYFRDKIKNEIKNSLKKDRIISKEDAEILRDFIYKLNNEIGR